MSSRERHTTGDLFAEYRRTGVLRIRNLLVERHLELAEDLARRYRGRGIEFDDLRQVAAIALVRAIERFDPGRGVPFRAFARATIDGEVKRHFRDHGWSVRPPRSVQETYLRVRATREELTQRLGRAPTRSAIAAAAGVSTLAVRDAEAAGGAMAASSLDETSLRPVEDPGFGRVEDQDSVEALVASLSPRDRSIVRLRYWAGLSQREIAELLGLSQMQISRVLRSSVERMTRVARAA